jgi:hypothetical protein
MKKIQSALTIVAGKTVIIEFARRRNHEEMP